MSKSSGQKLKLTYIREFLERNTDDEHFLTVNQIIDMLALQGIGAERKSIYDDIEQLRNFGVDIIAEKNKSTGYYIASRAFELAELKLLVDSVQSSRFLTKKKSTDLINKISTLCSKYEANQLNRQVYVANRVKSMNESIYYSVDEIHNAIISNKKITFKYFDYSIDKTRVFRKNGEKYLVSPFALISDNERYYLLAFDTQADMMKHYRVDKLVEVQISDLPRDGNAVFEKIDLGAYSDTMFSMYGGEMTNVKIRFDNSLISVVIDRFGKDVFLMKEDSEHFCVRVNVAVSPQFYGWIFSLEGGAKIISPQSAVDGMNKQLGKFSE